MGCLPTYKGKRYSSIEAVMAEIIKEEGLETRAQDLNPALFNKPMSEAQLNNKILDLQLSVLQNDAHATELLAPLSSKPLEDQIKRIKKKSRAFDHINSLHTNIYQEYINKFAKQAVGITATYITGQTMYNRAGIYINPEFKLSQVLGEAGMYHTLGASVSADGYLVSDLLKIWNNAALDNAKEPILGYLNVNELTINSALLMSSMGYSLDTTIDFINQPIVLEISKQMANNPNKTLSRLVKDMLAKSEYEPIRKKHAEIRKNNGNNIQQISISKLQEDKGLSPQEADANFQAEILYLFQQTVEVGRDLSKINKVLSPETAKNLSTFSAVEEFNGIIDHLEGSNSWLSLNSKIFNSSVADAVKSTQQKINESPLPRVTAFYERGLQAADSFSRDLFTYNTSAYLAVKKEIAELIGARNGSLSREQIDVVNAKLGFLLLTEDNKLAEAALKGVNVNSLLFDKEKSLAARLDAAFKTDPVLKKNPFLKNLSAGVGNKNTDLQSIYFNNTSDRSVEDQNSMTRGWLSLLRHSNPTWQKLGKDLATYSVLTSGFSTGPGSFFNLIPSEYFIDSGLTEAWENIKEKLEDPDYLSRSAEVVVRMGFQDLVSSLPDIISEDGIRPPVNNKYLKTEKVLNAEGNPILKKGGKPNLAIKEFTIDIDSTPEAQIQGIAGKKKPKPYLKIYHAVQRVTSRGKVKGIKKLSGYRLYKLTQEGKINATYKEVQPLGEKYRFVEGKINDPARRSAYPKWKGRSVSEFITEVFQLEPMDVTDTERYEMNSEIEEKLRSFLTSIGVKVQALESLQDKFGVDAKGAADLTNSIVYVLNSKEGLNALPEETAHFFVEGLADHKLLQKLIDKVEGTPEYAAAREQYYEVYKGDDLKIRKEAAAKLIAKHLIKTDPVSKNWLRRLLQQVKDLINRVFQRRNPFKESARYILENKTEMLSEAPVTSGVMYALDATQDIRNEDALFYERDFEAEETERIEAFSKEFNIDMSTQAVKNLKTQFKKDGEKVAKVIDKIRKSLATRIKRLELRGQSIPDSLTDIQDSLNTLEGMQFLKDLSEGALKSVESVENQMDAYKFDIKTPEKNLAFIDRLQHQLASFSHLEDLSRILKGNQDKNNPDPDLEKVRKMVEDAVTVVNQTLGDLREKEANAFGSWMRAVSTRGYTPAEVDKILEEVTTDTGIFDRGFLSLSDSSDEILSVVGKKLKMIENIALEKTSDYLRGTKNSPGLTKVTAALLKHKGTQNLEKLYEDFVVWTPNTNPELKREGNYKFIVDPTELGKNADPKIKKKWAALMALDKDHPSRQFYKYAIEPYLEERAKLHEKGMKSVIGDFNSVPTRRKRASELSVGTVDWAKTKLKNLKDELRVVADDDFIGAVDEFGKPINFIPYRYNFAGEMQKEDFSMEVANGLALAMENIHEANEKRDALPLVEAAQRILATRVFRNNGTTIDEKSGKASAAYKKFDTMLKMHFFGDEDVDAKFMGMDARKLTRASKSALSFLNLGFNFASQIVNPIVQGYFVLNNAVGGRDYTVKDLRKGYAKASRKMAGMLADYHSKNPKSKDTLLMERLGVFSHGLEDINLGRKDNFINNFMVKTGYAGFKLGNAMIQPGMAYAMMGNKKITLKSGKQITFEEAWEMQNGSLVFNEEAKKAMGGDEAVALYISQIQNAVRKISDNRALSDKGTAEHHWAGKFVMMHRSWMVPMFMNLMAKGHFEETTGRWEEGSIRAAAKAISKVATKENVLQWKNLAFQFDTLTTKNINPSTGKPFTEDQLAAYKANIRKSVTMLYSWVALTLLKSLAWDDEDKKDSYSYYLTLRTKAEIFSMLDPQDVVRVLKSPSAALNNVESMLQVLRYSTYDIAGGLERIDRGPYEDWMHVTKAWSRFVPVHNQYMNLKKTADKIKFMQR